MSGPGTQRGTGVHTNGAPGPEEEMQLDRQRYPDRFEHIWCGDYAKAFEGAYYASVLADARREGRFCELKQDPILPIKLFWDDRRITLASPKDEALGNGRPSIACRTLW